MNQCKNHFLEQSSSPITEIRIQRLAFYSVSPQKCKTSFTILINGEQHLVTEENVIDYGKES